MVVKLWEIDKLQVRPEVVSCSYWAMCEAAESANKKACLTPFIAVIGWACFPLVTCRCPVGEPPPRAKWWSSRLTGPPPALWSPSRWGRLSCVWSTSQSLVSQTRPRRASMRAHSGLATPFVWGSKTAGQRSDLLILLIWSHFVQRCSRAPNISHYE